MRLIIPSSLLQRVDIQGFIWRTFSVRFERKFANATAGNVYAVKPKFVLSERLAVCYTDPMYFANESRYWASRTNIHKSHVTAQQILQSIRRDTGCIKMFEIISAVRFRPLNKEEDSYQFMWKHSIFEVQTRRSLKPIFGFSNIGTIKIFAV